MGELLLKRGCSIFKCFDKTFLFLSMKEFVKLVPFFKIAKDVVVLAQIAKPGRQQHILKKTTPSGALIMMELFFNLFSKFISILSLLKFKHQKKMLTICKYIIVTFSIVSKVL